jgi:hypothetical protein
MKVRKPELVGHLVRMSDDKAVKKVFLGKRDGRRNAGRPKLRWFDCIEKDFNPLSPELNPICYLLALLAHDFLRVSRIRVKSLTLSLLMSYIYMEHLFLMFLDHTRRRSTVGRTPLDE